MLSHHYRQMYYIFMGPFMWISGILYKKFKAPRKGCVRVHLGAGKNNYIDNWINLDANIFTAKADVWADLRNPLPFQTGSVDSMYSYHVIEHLPDIDYHMREAHRCLKPGGVYRVCGPNGDSAIAKFIQNDLSWFSDFPVRRESIGGKLENFIFCNGEHLTMLTYSFIEEIMTKAGFVNIRKHKPGKETDYQEMFNECLLNERESDLDTPHTLAIEGAKERCGESKSGGNPN